VFGFTFAESQWVMPDAEGTWTEHGWMVYTPQECIERALKTFYEGLTEQEREQARKTFRISARQAQHDLLLWPSSTFSLSFPQRIESER
jgi:hypothetical protein